MPFALHIDVVPEKGGKIAVEHVFYGYTEAECRQVFATHADGCEFLGPAIEEDRIEKNSKQSKRFLPKTQFQCGAIDAAAVTTRGMPADGKAWRRLHRRKDCTCRPVAHVQRSGFPPAS